MSVTSSRDNWERLVAAVIKREQIWQLCHQDSITTINSSHFSERNLSFSSNSLPSVSSRSSPSSQPPPTNNSVVEVRRNGSGTITQKLFSALLGRRKPKDYDLGKNLVRIPSGDGWGGWNGRRFSLRDLQVATDNFSHENIIGRGRYSTVYKGWLAYGCRVAIKRQKRQVTEAELEIESLVKHRNVLRLHGFCITQKEQMLVYPYMVNGSVASWLIKERPKTQAPLEWAVRKVIALGVAWALAYLHHELPWAIIHRDVKAANIFLNEEFEVFVTNFTLAKFTDCNDDDDRVQGTFGHMAPEYISTGKCSLKTDVFGYGVFLLELITGQQAFDLAWLANDDDLMLVDRVTKLCEEKNFEAMVDGNLEGFVEKKVEKLLQIALICTQTDPDRRPTMHKVARMVEYEDGLAERWEEFSHK